MKKRISLIISLVLSICLVSGCATRKGRTAMEVAEKLVEAGSYTEAAEQCAIAIGNGVKDKKFTHMAEVLNLYNSALTLYESDKIDSARDKIAQIVDYSDLKMATDIEILKDRIGSYDRVKADLDDVKIRYNNKDYSGAYNKLSGIDYASLTENQRKEYDKLQGDLLGKPGVGGFGTYTDITDYSQYDNSLSPAYIAGAETGNVYFWNNADDNSSSGTLPNGTAVSTTGQKSNGRTLVKWNGRYGWITSKYLSSGYTSTDTNNWRIQGASAGNVYVWVNASGDEYYTTIPNGTIVYPTGVIRNNRAEISWRGGYAWITAEYVR